MIDAIALSIHPLLSRSQVSDLRNPVAKLLGDACGIQTARNESATLQGGTVVHATRLPRQGFNDAIAIGVRLAKSFAIRFGVVSALFGNAQCRNDQRDRQCN